MWQWLHKEERKLLKRYYLESKKTRDPFEIGLPEVMKILGFNENKESAESTGEKFDMALNTNVILKERKLIQFEHEPENQSRIKINLTLEGYDLGRKYSSKIHTFLLLCNEYKVWIILGFIISFIGLIIAILKD